MTRSRSIDKRLHNQRGVVIIWFTLLLPVLLGFAALAIDVARLYLTKVELQNAADAATLAGASAVSGSPGSYNWSNVESDARQIATSNFANGSKIQQATIDTGYWDSSNPAAGLQHPANPTGYFPAVQVTITISNTKNNGPLNLLFAPILGITSKDVSATAVAAQPVATPSHSILVQ
jgi:Flp pilus assembly protein TadG